MRAPLTLNHALKSSALRALRPTRQTRNASNTSTTTRTRKTTTTNTTPNTTHPRIPRSLLSPHHHNLPTFFAHARLTSLSPTSPTYLGTHYEYLCVQSLLRLGFHLTRIGRPSDLGIDLLGTLSLPSLPLHTPLRVLIQCKRLTTRLTPSVVRELSGAFAGAPVGWRGEGVMALVCSTKEASRGVREAMGREGRAVGYLCVEPRGGRVRQFVWNGGAAGLGLEGVGVVVRYFGGRGGQGEIGRGDGEGEGKGKGKGRDGRAVESEIALTWEGKVLDLTPKEEVKKRRGRPRKKDSATAHSKVSFDDVAPTIKRPRRKSRVRSVLPEEPGVVEEPKCTEKETKAAISKAKRSKIGSPKPIVSIDMVPAMASPINATT